MYGINERLIGYGETMDKDKNTAQKAQAKLLKLIENKKMPLKI